MALREKILEEQREKKRVADAFNKLPVPTEEPLEMVAAREKEDRQRKEDPVERPSFSVYGERQMSWADRIRGLEGAVSDLGNWQSEDSERLMRIERMLVEVLKKMDL